MGYPNINSENAAAVQAEMRGTILKLRPQRAITYQSTKETFKKKNARMAGLDIPFEINAPNGSSTLNPVGGGTSFLNYVPSKKGKMFAGLTYSGFTVEWEHFHNFDAENGNQPESKRELRDGAMLTYWQERNWYIIGKGDGSLGVVTNVSGSNLTLAYDNTARGRSKGSVRLHVSYNTAANKRILYQSINTSTGAVTATFYVTAKASAVGATITITDGGTVSAGNIIVKYGHYNMTVNGYGYHADNSTARWYQGAYTGDHPNLAANRINGLGGTPTPTMVNTAKQTCAALANDKSAQNRRMCRLTRTNLNVLETFGYELRQEKGDAMTTYGLPNYYTDGDTDFVDDMDWEDCEMLFHDRKSLFIWRLHDLRELFPSDKQYVGANLVGSTEGYKNWGEACNLVWDGAGDDDQGAGGSSNSMVYIDNLAMPSITQVSMGRSLV